MSGSPSDSDDADPPASPNKQRAPCCRHANKEGKGAPTPRPLAHVFDGVPQPLDGVPHAAYIARAIIQERHFAGPCTGGWRRRPGRAASGRGDKRVRSGRGRPAPPPPRLPPQASSQCHGVCIEDAHHFPAEICSHSLQSAVHPTPPAPQATFKRMRLVGDAARVLNTRAGCDCNKALPRQRPEVEAVDAMIMPAAASSRVSRATGSLPIGSCRRNSTHAIKIPSYQQLFTTHASHRLLPEA